MKQFCIEFLVSPSSDLMLGQVIATLAGLHRRSPMRLLMGKAPLFCSGMIVKVVSTSTCSILFT